jgi:hypothetical protein
MGNRVAALFDVQLFERLFAFAVYGFKLRQHLDFTSSISIFFFSYL